MAIKITQNAEDLKTLFNDVEEVFYSPSEITKALLTSSGDIEVQEFPVTEEGVNFDPGSAEVDNFKLTTGKIWTTKVTKGDPDISFQLPAIPGEINDLFLEKGSEITSDVEFSGDKAPKSLKGILYSASAYTLTPKKVKGALIMPSEDRETVIILPNVEMYASPKTDGSNPMYFDVKVTPVANSDGDEIYILTKKKLSGQSTQSSAPKA